MRTLFLHVFITKIILAYLNLKLLNSNVVVVVIKQLLHLLILDKKNCSKM